MIHTQEILIPKARIAALIGEKGASRKLIEKAGKIKLWIESDTGNIKIISKDPTTVWIAESVIEAVGRGFSPQDAILLFKDDYSFELIDMREFSGKSKDRQKTMRGRIIGTEGKVKGVIQKYTGVKIAIQGKTIGIIGKTEDAFMARQAVERILSGAKQGSAFGFLREKYELE